MEGSRPKRRRPSVGVVLIAIGLVAFGVIVVRGLLDNGESGQQVIDNGPVVHTTGTAATATASIGGSTPTKTGPPLSGVMVFAAPRDPTDALPEPLHRSAVALVAGGTPGKPAHGKLGESRRIAAVRGTTYYAWPIGKAGMCTGLGDGTAARCTDVAPASGEIGPTLVASGGGRKYVGAVVGPDVVALTVNAPGYTCSVHVERSGFICIGPDKGAKTVIATMSLRKGGTTSVAIS